VRFRLAVWGERKPYLRDRTFSGAKDAAVGFSNSAAHSGSVVLLLLGTPSRRPTRVPSRTAQISVYKGG
jgi:hypothetical protein